jgi:hypothetical protein
MKQYLVMCAVLATVANTSINAVFAYKQRQADNAVVGETVHCVLVDEKLVCEFKKV